MILEAIPAAIAEILAFVLGKITGRTFKLEKRQAQRIGEYIVFALIAGTGLTITLIYS